MSGRPETNLMKNITGKVEFCTHPIVNQIRHVYTWWNRVKTSVQVGYCKVCDKIVMSEGQEWLILEKQEKKTNEKMGTQGEV